MVIEFLGGGNMKNFFLANEMIYELKETKDNKSILEDILKNRIELKETEVIEYLKSINARLIREEDYNDIIERLKQVNTC